MYTLVSTLSGHRNSINTVQFSPDGAYLVSGSEDGLLLIHTVNSWQFLLRFVSPSPITSLVWHPKLERVLFCGCKNGDVHRIQFSASGVRSFFQWPIVVLTRVRNAGKRSDVGERNTRPNPLHGTP